jgi:hypothetical protein
MTANHPSIAPLLERLKPVAEQSGNFGPVSVRDGSLVCIAKAAAAPASYRVFQEGGKVWVSLVMADRWLSESIESDLMHTGDKMEDLLEEELIEHSAPATRLKIEHFRSDDLLFTFRSPLPVTADAGAAPGVARFLAAYEACFRNLGDMSAGE